ncbi:hypothetical protein [Ammoniphilus sp. CFH 90114]|uniref:hypothetical protein n=1 Tax=Ammoniphilus sp. CFH 90114 TaxID=2493665 RepID=UPI00100DB22E|nr:hypothetical protein [Ammoniphilus sp. CFH 90114]RXT03654.1 hypothetical protein EIZ39_23280 [Ammoniphilus sp. CFH 90114]
MSLTPGVSLKTGEHGILVPSGQGYRIISPAQDYAYTRRQTGRSHEFTFSSMVEVQEVIGKLEDKHCGYLLVLQSYTNFECILVRSQKKMPMNKKDIAEVLGLKETAFRDFFKAMISNNIIMEDKETGIVKLNQRYHFKGKLKELDKVLKTFTSGVRELFKMYNAKDLGFLYKIMPYVHYRDNLLCLNPFEENPNLISSINKSELAELTGTTRQTVDDKLNKMRLGQYQAFATVRRGNKVMIFVNPMIFYRQSGYPDKTLLTMFLAK